MRLALYQPDIAANTGTILRLAACMGVPVDIIAPTGFDMTDRTLRRAGLDYLDHVTIARHASFEAFLAARAGQRLGPQTGQGVGPTDCQAGDPASSPAGTQAGTRAGTMAGGGRLVLLTAHGATAHHRFAFEPGDTLMLGRESAGCPAEVHAAADARVTIPMQPGLRSLNIAVAAAIVLSEALRQTGGFAEPGRPPDAP